MAGAKQMESCRPLFKRFGLLTLTLIIIFETWRVYMFLKINHILMSMVITMELALVIREVFWTPWKRLVIGRRSPDYLGTQVYNHLPERNT